MRVLLRSCLMATALLTTTLAATAHGATDKVTFTNKLENGKKVWSPATATVKAGDKVELTLVNTLAEPHGFEIKELKQQIVIPAKETKTLNFDAPKAGTYKFNCQLHPAHVGGEIVVK